ncbi:hypothetical protein PF007_g18238 [Phytophthora fragariae]|uniref:ABC transmembrane type-1 domain-containing protein n=1 Tax=Phytophthora fragariae TaxID=53985 RepID=A0A6A3RA45_9STRA|nr:hypothetical protein PF007_g18238 [Phytophthora fragariae]
MDTIPSGAYITTSAVIYLKYVQHRVDPEPHQGGEAAADRGRHGHDHRLGHERRLPAHHGQGHRRGLGQTGLSRKGFVVVVLATFFTGSGGSFLRTYSLGVVAERIASKLRRRLYKVLLSQELAFYNNRKVDELVTRLSGECQQTANAVVDVLSNSYRSLNSAVGHKKEVQDLLSQHELPFVVF